jgi:DNA-directed RNA polymerase subunit N (RpoN/RPB10)
MIIPVRCFTCGSVLGDKWIPYITTVQEEKNKSNEEVDGEPTSTYIDLKNPKKSIEGEVLDEMGIHKYCCRRRNICIAQYVRSCVRWVRAGMKRCEMNIFTVPHLAATARR